GEGVNLSVIQRSSLAGRQVVGQDDNGFLEMLQLLAAVTEQVAKDCFFDVKEIDGSGNKMAAFQALQGLDMAAHHSADRVFGGKTVVTDMSDEFLIERRILDQHLVGGEDGAILGT